MKCLLFLLMVASTAYADGEDCSYYRRLDAITPEDPCSQEGGMCTFAEDCDNPAETGLCPKQQSQGVECCYGVSNKEKRCRKLGGECMNYCNPVVRVTKPTNCPPNKMCCILVN
ncbi:hypothetical protein ACJJTC_017873 [Scirpophaga incertulas]